MNVRKEKTHAAEIQQRLKGPRPETGYRLGSYGHLLIEERPIDPCAPSVLLQTTYYTKSIQQSPS
jgi:hypothetical protein